MYIMVSEKIFSNLYWCRRVVSFLYEGSKSGKGRTSCSFTLDTVFTTLVTNNVSTEEELKTQRIDDYYYSAMNKDANDTIKFIEENSRGKCFRDIQYKCEIIILL